jgi:hypothetical protein
MTFQPQQTQLLLPPKGQPQSAEPCFRFLDLLVELRLMVYEFLPFSTRRISAEVLGHDQESHVWNAVKGTTILVVECLPIGILVTSKHISTDAVSTLQPRLEA